MHNNLQTILFIDDDCDSYIESLEPFAKDAGFELQAFDNVLEGLNFIKEYEESVSAVILDLKFPTGEMQGFEALQKIKELQPDLPVIMFTVSYTKADIDLVVECMKKGAYNYIGKTNWTVNYLFQVVEKAVSESKLHERIKAITTIPENGFYFTTYKGNTDYYFFEKFGIFGFELISINKPRNEQEFADLQKKALLWHHNLMKAITIIYYDRVFVNLKYIAENKRLKCKVIFTVYEKNDYIDQMIKNVQHDIKVFFSPEKIDDTQPYVFEEIRDADELFKANSIENDYIHTVFYRNPIKVKTKRPIGYSSSENDSSKNKSDYQPDELFQMPVDLTFNNDLFSALLNQNDYVEIDVELRPKRLLPVEIDLIKQVINDSSLLDSESLSFDKRKSYIEYLQKFITNSKDKFIISVVLKRKSSNRLNHLKNSICGYFFGLDDDVKYQLRKPDSLYRFCTSDDFKINQLPFFYSVNDAIKAFRLPIPDLDGASGIKQLSHIFHYTPDNLATNGVLLGIKNDIHPLKEIRIDEKALARHLYIMGQTGTGKSTMLKTMILDCLNNNYGFTVIDPHGDLFDQVLEQIPQNKKKKVFIINTTDPEHSLKFNPLAYDNNMPQAKSLVVNEILKAIDSLYDLRTTGGPVFEQYFKNALFLLLDEEVVNKFGKATLANMLNVFMNDEFRRACIQVCANKNVTQFFKIAIAMSGESSFGNMASYITGKLTRFVEDFYLSPILNSTTDNINFRKLIDDGNIFLVKMDKGLIGSINTSLLGQIILSKIFLAGMSRSTLSADNRKPHYIFIDEFQNFVKGDVGNALSEVRKYGLNLILANQTLGQLDDYLIQSLIGNVGSLYFYVLEFMTMKR
jgi:FixJ family two-component response regulator